MKLSSRLLHICVHELMVIVDHDMSELRREAFTALLEVLKEEDKRRTSGSMPGKYANRAVEYDNEGRN